MRIKGGCYCGAVRYEAENKILMKTECFCRQCRYLTGGNSLLAMAVPSDGFTITGTVKTYTNPNIENAVNRDFCPECGTHLWTRALGFPQGMILKVGTLDTPGIFEKAESANYVCDAEPYHRLPDDMPIYQKWMK